MIKRLMKKKNQHYIPQFYQKLFSVNDKSIGKYMIAQKKYIKNSAIKKNGVISYYYGKDETIENMFMELESEASSIIERIIESEAIPPRESNYYDVIILFLLTLEARVKRMGDYHNEWATKFTKSIIRLRKVFGNLDVNEEIIDDAKMQYKIPTLLSIKTAIQCKEYIDDLRCCLIVSDTSSQFITSDNPVVRYNYMYNYRNYNRNYGVANMGIQIFLPISPKICLYVYDNIMYNTIPSKDGNFHIKKTEEIDKLNTLFYMNSYDFILFNEYLKEDYIIKILDKKKNLKQYNFTNPFFGGDKSGLITMEMKSVHQHINIPMFKINSELIEMPLPPHMGGPTRPKAGELEKLHNFNSK